MKHLKKDDGYVLVYVLIVFTILSFVAVSICSTALNNLKAQKADVARMEARYEAEGYLQQFVAFVAEVETEETVADAADVANATDDVKAAALAAAKTAFWAKVVPSEITGVTVEFYEPDPPPGSDKEAVTIVATAKKAGYIATIRAKAEITIETTFESKAICKMKNDGWTYISYDISYEEVSE